MLNEGLYGGRLKKSPHNPVLAEILQYDISIAKRHPLIRFDNNDSAG